MTIGLAAAAAEARYHLDVPLAVDDAPVAADTFFRNFPDANVVTGKVEHLIDGGLGDPITTRERALRRKIGEVSILMGGPPCQGHSDLNNHTRRDDPRNRFYARMARAARVLRPQVVLIENVAQVAHDRRNVVEVTAQELRAQGYQVHAEVLDLRKIGVPQWRRRHVLVAVSQALASPESLFHEIGTTCSEHPRTVRWAIQDLEDVDAQTAFDLPSMPSPDNRKRIDKLFRAGIYDLDNADRPPCHRDKQHTYKSMYGRLHWDKPAQTITTGFGSMGQGRYVHPSRKRTLTPHEAARLQTIPDYVQLGIDERRGAWAEMIGNAVPPLLTKVLGGILIPRLAGAPDPPAAKQGR